MAFFSTGEDQVKVVEAVAEALYFLERELNGKKFFGGKAMGFLDMVVGWIAYWFQFVEEVGGFKVIDSTKYPAFNSWINNFVEVPLIKEKLPPPDAFRHVFLGFKNMSLAIANAEE